MIAAQTRGFRCPACPTRPTATTVAPEWIDYNGHMNVAYYVLAFDRATDRLFDYLGIGEAYRRATHHSVFALEAHVTYERELRQGEEFEIATRLIDADRKRLHLFHAMTRAKDNELSATIEVMGLHVDMAGHVRRRCPTMSTPRSKRCSPSIVFCRHRRSSAARSASGVNFPQFERKNRKRHAGAIA